MAKKEKESEKEKITEDLTPEKNPKGGRTTAVNATLANMTTNATLATPTAARPRVPVRRGR